MLEKLRVEGLLSHPDELKPDRELNLNKLRDVIIFPFYECNWRCKHCTVRKPAGEVGFLASAYTDFEHHIDLEHIRRINEWNVKYVTILGGEPFLSVCLPDILSELKNSKSKITVYTNGTLLAKADMKDLKPVLESMDYLTISIEGDDFWNSRIRGKTFDKVLKVIEKVEKFVKPVIRAGYWNEIVCERCGKPLVREDYCFTCKTKPVVRDQIADLIKLIGFFNEQDIPVEVAPTFGLPPLTRSRARWFYAALASCKMADCLLPSYKNYIGFKITCPAGWNRLSINPEGYITGCQWSSKYFATLEWDDDAIIDAANRWRARHCRIMPECYGCELMDVCRSSCKVAMDYLECPVKDYSLDKTDDGVRIGDEVRKISRIKAMKNLKNMRALSPGIC